MVTVLSVPLTGQRKGRQNLHGIISKKINTFGKRKRIAWEGLSIQCLEGLHKVIQATVPLILIICLIIISSPYTSEIVFYGLNFIVASNSHSRRRLA